jgi:filamentous hemagglutinin family protein
MTTTIERSGLRRRMRRKLLRCCWPPAGWPAPAAQAAPTLPQVVNGQASFNQQGNVFSITNTPGTIINWQSFNIGAGEITRFIQQSSDSAVLNRIVGQDPTKILGALQSNGKVFLINPNGILFGQGSRVDVNGLVASTLNLSDADFLAGKKNFQAGVTAAQAGAQRRRHHDAHRRQGIPDRAERREHRHHHGAERRSGAGGRPQRAAGRFERPEPAGGGVGPGDQASTWARSSPRAAASASTAPW